MTLTQTRSHCGLAGGTHHPSTALTKIVQKQTFSVNALEGERVLMSRSQCDLADIPSLLGDGPPPPKMYIVRILENNDNDLDDELHKGPFKRPCKEATRATHCVAGPPRPAGWPARPARLVWPSRPAGPADRYQAMIHLQTNLQTCVTE